MLTTKYLFKKFWVGQTKHIFCWLWFGSRQCVDSNTVMDERPIQAIYTSFALRLHGSHHWSIFQLPREGREGQNNQSNEIIPEGSSSCCHECPGQRTVGLLGMVLPAEEQRLQKDTAHRAQRASADPVQRTYWKGWVYMLILQKQDNCFWWRAGFSILWEVSTTWNVVHPLPITSIEQSA